MGWKQTKQYVPYWYNSIFFKKKHAVVLNVIKLEESCCGCAVHLSWNGNKAFGKKIVTNLAWLESVMDLSGTKYKK